MRNASLSIDESDDFRERPQRPRAKKARAASKKPSAFARLRKQPGRVLVGVLGLGVTGGIILNATWMQNARHPAPLFAPSSPAPAPTNKEASVPTPAAHAGEATQAAGATQPTPAVPPNAAPHAAAARPAPQAVPHAEAPAPKKDAIAALLRADALSESSPRVAAAQRALQKVGFVVKPDGLINTTTRQAIAHFERERGLPVTSDLSPRTMRELVAQSGVTIP